MMGNYCWFLIAEMKDQEISKGLIHLVKRHGSYREKLHFLHLVESNLFCHEVATPTHIVLYYRETEELCREERNTLKDFSMFDALRRPGHPQVLRSLANKVI